MPDLACSLIINTYNRAPYLQRLLAGLAHLAGQPFEVIVVNGPSDDASAGVLASYNGQIKVVACPSRNLSVSRNLGIAAAAGSVVAFIDDDALPADASWLTRFAAAFAADTSGRLGALGGPVWHADSDYLEFAGGATSDYGFQRFGAGEASAPQGQRWFTGVRGCNCAFRRSALVAIGGFDAFFSYYLDESDVCMRLIRAGYTVGYLDNNAVRHFSAPSPTRTSIVNRDWRTITRSDSYFAMKNGGDALPRRLLKTLAAAPRKHYIAEINSYLLHGQVSPLGWLRMRARWARGLADGVYAGLRAPRQLANLASVPPPLPFTRPQPTRRLRVALLSQTLAGDQGGGGIARYSFDLALGLHRLGHEVHLICRSEQRLRHHSLGLAIHGIAAAESSGRGLDPRPLLDKNLGYSLAVAARIAELEAAGQKFDIVHASNWDAEALALIRKGGLPVALMLVSPLAQVIASEGWQASDDLRALVALDQWQIAHAAVVCVPSRGVIASYQQRMGLLPEALPYLRLAPLGIFPDPAAATPAAPAQAAPKRLLFVGRLERRKGAHTLLAALPALLRRFPGWECHIVGDDTIRLAEGGTLRQRFLRQHRWARWRRRVIFHGQVSEEALRQHYRACDLFVAPSRFESFGLIYHEAMQHGKAVVGCHTGGVPEVVAHAVEGLLVAPDSPDKLAAALARLMGDAALRARMGEAGRRRVHEAQNYLTMARALEAIYLETINGRMER